MPHVTELGRAAAVAALAVAITVSAGCTDSHRRAPLAGVPTGETVARSPVYRLPPIDVVGRRPQDVAVPTRGNPPFGANRSAG
jgi:hypothetical protein